MASGDKIFIADKETLDSVKGDTTELKSTATTILETGYAVLEVLKGQRPKRYGYRVKESEASSSDRVEYLFDAADMTPAHMNFASGTFDMGSWGDVWFVRDNKPVMVKSDGSVDYELDHNNHAYKAVDGTASDVSNTGYEGNAMSAMPTVWLNRYRENGYRYVITCPVQFDEGYKAYAHTRQDGSIAPFAYGAMYEGSTVSNKLRSLSGQYPMNTQSATTELTQAKNNGSAWTITTWAWWELIMDLLTLMGKSTNHKAVFGNGHTTGWTDQRSLNDTGALDDKGQFYGFNSTTGDCKVFYITNVMWGDRWERIVGMVQDHGIYKVKMTPEGGGYNFTGAGYTAISRTPAGVGWLKGGYESKCGLLPTDTTGSEGYYDACYFHINLTILSVPLVGGSCNNGSECGRYVSVYNAVSRAEGHIGASLYLQNPS